MKIQPAAINLRDIRARLRSVQRLGFKLIAEFRRGTPNSGLELIFNCSPVEVHLAKMATKAYFRTMQHAPYTMEQLATPVVSRISHRSWIKKLIDYQGLTYLEGPLDVVPLYRRWERKFQVDMYSMSPHNPTRGIPDPRGYNIFTDGSKDGNKTGAGVVIMNGGQVSQDSEGNDRKYSYHLGDSTTVFQSEVFAQKMAANLILNGSFGAMDWVANKANSGITIHTDNQASLWALNNV